MSSASPDETVAISVRSEITPAEEPESDTPREARAINGFNIELRDMGNSDTVSLISADQNRAVSRPADRVEVFGYHVTGQPEVQYALVGFIAVLLACGLQALQELIWPHFPYGNTTSFLLQLTMASCAVLEKAFSKRDPNARKGSIGGYVMMGFFMVLIELLNVAASHAVSLSLNLFFNAFTLAGVTAVAFAVDLEKFSLIGYLGIALISIGSCIFVQSGLSPPHGDFAGVIILFLALLLKAMLPNFLIQGFFAYGTPVPEMIVYTSALHTVWSFLLALGTGELGQALGELSQGTPLLALLLGVVAYLCTTVWFLSLKFFGSVNTELLRTIKMLLIVATSTHALDARYMAGGMMTMAGMVMMTMAKHLRNPDPPSPDEVRAVMKLQALIRGRRARDAYRRQKEGIKRLQAFFRGRKARDQAKKMAQEKQASNAFTLD